MGGKYSYFENKALAAAVNGSGSTFAAPASVYSALFTVIPSATTTGTEVTNASSGYTRVVTSFCSAGLTVNGQAVNTNVVTFVTAAAAYTVVGWALMDAIASGNMLYWATVTTLAVAIGNQVTFAAGAIVITEA